MTALPSQPSQATIRRNPHLFGTTSEQIVAGTKLLDKAIKTSKRLRQSTKPLMNKLESEFHHRLTCSMPSATLRAQALKFKLGNGIFYKPDFTAFIDRQPMAWEVKGPHSFRGGFENLKVVASQWPEWRFILVWKDKSGQWQEQVILT